MRKQEAGFTLIELVVVIIILGILAAVALPKFIGLSADARASVVTGLDGSVTEAANMVHALAVIQGKTSSTATTVTLSDGTTVNVVNGYPDDTLGGINNALQSAGAVSATFPFTYTANSPATFVYTATATATPMTGCEVDYTSATVVGTVVTPPVIVLNTGSC